MPLILGLAVVLLVLMGIGAIVGFALVGGDGTSAPRSSANEPAPAEDPEPTRQNANNSAEDSQPPTEQELGVGDSVEVEGIEATLNEVRVLPATDLDRPIQNPDNRFLAADVTFENVSEGAVSVSSLLEFVLKNEEGYSASQTVHTQQRELAEGEIAPGEKASGEIVYEVPPESRGLQLDYTPFVRGGTYTWAIGDLQDVAIAPRPKEPRPPTSEPTSPAHEQRPARLRGRGRRGGHGLLPGRRPRRLGLHLRNPRPGPSTPKTSGTSRTSSSPTQRAWSSPQ
jgi:hypothetical protein